MIRLRSVLVEFEDDPFEIRLDNNYTLLAEEHAEQVNRHKVLVSKLESLRATPGVEVSEEYEEQLFSSLDEKNAQIYCKLARELRATYPLFTFQWEDVCIAALSDERFTGKANIEDRIREMDPNSSYPKEGIAYSELIARKVHVTSRDMAIKLRDYNVPLLSADSLNMRGSLIISEVSAPETAVRSVSVPIGAGRRVTIKKGMTPFKVYHELEVDAKILDLCWGPCYEPVLQELALTADRLTTNSADPSSPLAWFDKARLMRHGNAVLCADRLAIMVLASANPRKATDYLEVEMNNFSLTWSAGVHTVRGDTTYRIFTPTKFNRCPLFFMPSLEIELALKWQCDGDENNHHRVLPCAPEHARPGHDSFAGFRSTGLSVTTSISVREAESSRVFPGILFYASTLKWLAKLMVKVPGITHPVRRGALFNPVPPPQKPGFGEHIKEVRMTISLPRTSVTYFNSYERGEGFRLDVESFNLSAVYLHRAVAPAPALLRGADLVMQRRLQWDIEKILAETGPGSVVVIRNSHSHDGVFCCVVWCVQVMISTHFCFLRLHRVVFAQTQLPHHGPQVDGVEEARVE